MFDKNVELIRIDHTADNGVVLTIQFLEPPEAYSELDFDWETLEQTMVFANDEATDNGYDKAVEWLMEQFVPELPDTSLL